MKITKINTCCFFGHRKIKETDQLKLKLQYEIEKLIVNDDVHTFLFGSKSQFDKLCYKTVTNLKEKHPHIKRIYVRASYPDIDKSYTDYLLESYEHTYYPEKMRGATKASYVMRNKEMIDKSNFCVIYYDENYLPPSKKISKQNLLSYQPKSGTRIAYDYAVKKNSKIVNIFTT